MEQPKLGFSKDPLKLSCVFDPKEQFYIVGFTGYVNQWSFDYDSTVKALESFLTGTGTNVPIQLPLPDLLKNDPVVILKYDETSFENLKLESKKQNKTPEDLIKNLLRVSVIQIVCS